MEVIKNLAWARHRVARYVHFNVDEADEAFSGPQSDPWEQIDDALNEGLTEVYNKVADGIDPDYFKISVPWTWPAGLVQASLPTGVDRTSVLEMRDVTTLYPGLQIRPSPGYNGTSEIYWSGLNQITWGTVGPTADTSIVISYILGAKTMKDPVEEPEMLPYRFRDLWPLRAAILLREAVDEDNIPTSWLQRFKELEWQFHNAVQQRSESGSYDNPPRSTFIP